jgi:exonuclease VII small subunit
MKIIGNGNLPGPGPVEKTALHRPAAVNDFGEILKKTIDQASASDPVAAAAAALRFQSVTPTPDPSVVGCLEGYLDLLENYCQKLSNPRVSLKGLEASIRQLEEGRDALSQALGSLPEDDRLNDVLNQTLVTAELEIIRFRRGDYLPA